MAKSKYQIFVSSTYEGLKDERDAVIKAILETGNIPVGMEMFSAGDEQQWELIKRQIDDCDYYVVVLAHRYGSFDGAISYTEKEYDYAVEQKIPVLGFIISEDASWSKKKVDTDAVAVTALSIFKEKVKKKMVSFWKTADDLQGKVAISLSKAFGAYPRPGWVRATDDMGPGVTSELSRLSKENADLRKSLSVSEARAKTEEQDYRRRILQALFSNKFRFALFYADGREFEDSGSVTLFRVFTMIAPYMLIETSSTDLNYTLALQLDPDTSGKRVIRTEAPLPTNYLDGLLADFAVLGLVQPSSKPHPVEDGKIYWTLTGLGRTIHKEIRLRALFGNVKSDASAKGPKTDASSQSDSPISQSKPEPSPKG